MKAMRLAIFPALLLGVSALAGTMDLAVRQVIVTDYC